MIQPFQIRATVTGFNDGEIILNGIFEWEFDANGERLLSQAARNISLSRDQFLTSTGKLFTFSAEIVDLTQRRLVEDRVAGSLKLRDVAHIQVKLLGKHNDGAGMVNRVLDVAELRRAGNAYFDPPLPP